MSRYPALLLDVKLMTIEDIDGLHQEPVRIHLSGGSCDISVHWRRVELLPPCYGSASRSLLCPYVSHSSVCSYQCNLCQKRGKGRRREGRKQWRAQQHLNTKWSSKISAAAKAIPPRPSCTYQRCQSSGWNNSSDPWWDHFIQVWLNSPCFCLDIFCLTGPKLRIFDRLIEKHPLNKSPL